MTSLFAPRVRVRRMAERHLDQVLAIERVVFPAPWSRALYREEVGAGPTRNYLVAIRRRRVLGYIGVMLVGEEAHVTTVAVATDIQGQGIGRMLLLHALVDAVRAGARAATLEVRVSNRGAQALYHQFGFVPAGIRKNYYAEVNEDGLVMWAYDLDRAEFAARVARAAAAVAARGLPVPRGVDALGQRR